MAGSTIDPKTKRITLRLSINDLRLVHREAQRQRQSVGLVIRKLIRDHLARSSKK
jgi:predicted DNA binding CopG/RHH family protein